MSTIQIRNVPEDVHRQLKIRAAESGQSLSDYLLREVLEHAQKPTLAQWADAVLELPRRGAIPPVGDILREERRR